MRAAARAACGLDASRRTAASSASRRSRTPRTRARAAPSRSSRAARARARGPARAVRRAAGGCRPAPAPRRERPAHAHEQLGRGAREDGRVLPPRALGETVNTAQSGVGVAQRARASSRERCAYAAQLVSLGRRRRTTFSASPLRDRVEGLGDGVAVAATRTEIAAGACAAATRRRGGGGRGCTASRQRCDQRRSTSCVGCDQRRARDEARAARAARTSSSGSAKPRCRRRSTRARAGSSVRASKAKPPTASGRRRCARRPARRPRPRARSSLSQRARARATASSPRTVSARAQPIATSANACARARAGRSAPRVDARPREQASGSIARPRAVCERAAHDRARAQARGLAACAQLARELTGSDAPAHACALASTSCAAPKQSARLRTAAKPARCESREQLGLLGQVGGRRGQVAVGGARRRAGRRAAARCVEVQAVPRAQQRGARRVDLEQREPAARAPARARTPRARRRARRSCAARSRSVTTSRSHRANGSFAASACTKPQRAVRARARAQHRAGEVDADHARAALGRELGQIAGAAGEVDHAIAATHTRPRSARCAASAGRGRSVSSRFSRS